MNDEIEIDKTLVEPNRFKKINLFHRGGAARVFYKGDAPEVKETEHERALAEIANAKWDYYKEHYEPIENEYMEQVDSMGKEGSEKFVQGAASGSTQAAFSGAKSELDDSLQKAGYNPNSGRAKAAGAGLRDAEGKSLTKNLTSSAIENQDQHITGVRNVAMMGRGEATVAQQGLSDLASISHRNAVNDAQQSLADEQNTNYAAGSLIGAGARGYMEYKDKPTVKVGSKNDAATIADPDEMLGLA